MATNQADIPVIIQGTVNPPINQKQQLVVGGQTDPKTFTVKPLKICGGIQIGCGILGIIGVIMDFIALNENYDNKFGYSTFLSSRLTTSAVICLIGSVWFIMTGYLPLFMSRKREKSWRIVGCLACSIIGAGLIVPIMFIWGLLMLRVSDRYGNGEVGSGSIFRLLLPFIEMVLAIISASFCCCCTPWGNQYRSVQSTVMFMNASQPGIPMNYQPNVLMTTGQPVNSTVQYQRAQQYVVTTHQPLNIQQFVLQQPENLQTDNPPAYTKEK